MSLIGLAFGARDRRPSNGAPELGKVLADLHVSEQENDVPVPPALEPQVIEPPAPAPGDQDHRDRLERLLGEARRIAQMLEKEAGEAALVENLKLDEKLAAVTKLAQAEAEAEAHARALAQENESAALHRAQFDADVAAAQRAVTEAEDSVKELEARLAESQDAVLRAKSHLSESEGRAHNFALQATMNAANIDEAEARIAKCREAREAAEAEVREAKAIARSIMQTAATLKQLKTLSAAGAPDAATSSKDGLGLN